MSDTSMSLVTIQIPTERLPELCMTLSKFSGGGWEWLKQVVALEPISGGQNGPSDGNLSVSRNEHIINTAIEILSPEPPGLRTGELLKNRMRQALPNLKLGNARILHLLIEYAKKRDALIYQPAHGWFRHKKYQ